MPSERTWKQSAAASSAGKLRAGPSLGTRRFVIYEGTQGRIGEDADPLDALLIFGRNGIFMRDIPLFCTA